MHDDPDDEPGTIYPHIRAALERQLANAERREHGDAFRRADDEPLVPDANPVFDRDTLARAFELADDEPGADDTRFRHFISDTLGVDLASAHVAVYRGDPRPGTHVDLYPVGKPEPRGLDAHLAILDEAPTFRGRLVDPEPELIADGDGNPLSAGFRDELDAQRS